MAALNTGVNENQRIAANRVYRPLVISLMWDIALNATIPLACYIAAKKVVLTSELIALVFATAFPVLKSAYDLLRHREFDPVAALVFLGITTSILAVFLGGDSHILLIKESLFTAAFGIACLISLTFPRPIMFYFGRHFMAGKDFQKRKVFESRWQNPTVRRAHRVVTIVWGLVYVAEFVVRIALLYSMPTAVVLGVSPFLIGLATITAIVWTFWYAQKIRERIST
jgi:hypothetical protein